MCETRMKINRTPTLHLLIILLTSICILAIQTAQPARAGEKPPEKEASAADDASRLTVGAVRIRIHEVMGDAGRFEEMARDLLTFNVGDPFAPRKIQESLEALKLSHQFETIHMDANEEGGQITIYIDLTPFKRIKKIRITDNFPIFEREILNVMTLYTGDALAMSALPEQKKLTEDLFRREGFIRPQATVKAFLDPEDGLYTLLVRIDKGPYYKIERLDIEGNEAFSDKRLKLRMKTWPASLLPGGAGRFVEKTLQRDVRKLIAFYRKKRFPDVEIRSDVNKDDETGAVHARITVEEGRRYEVEFIGNAEFWDYTLKKDLVMFQEGNRGDLGLKKSVRKIKERYRGAGYLETEVNVAEDKTPDEEGVRRLAFHIKEGPFTSVGELRVTGAGAFEDEKVKEQILTRPPGMIRKGAYVPETLEEDKMTVKTLYLKEGYADAEVKEDLDWNEGKTEVDVTLRIQEGPRTIVSSVEITGVQSVPAAEAFEAIQTKEGAPYRDYLVNNDANVLAAMISEKGRPHVTVTADADVGADRKTARVVFHVAEGPYVEMGDVYFTGNLRTKRRILENELAAESGAPFSLDALLETQRNIRNLNVFDSVQFKTIGLKEQRDEITLFVEVEEKKPYFVQAGAGYDTERSFYVNGKLGDRNLFGTNKEAWIGGELSQIGYRGDLVISEPRLFGSRTSAALNLFGEEREEFNQDFGSRTYGAALGFSRKWFKHFSTGLDFKCERRTEYALNGRGIEIESESTDGEYDPRTIFVASPSVAYDTRDSFVRPKKGVYAALGLDASNGLDNSLDDFIKYEMDLRFFYTPLRRLTLACRGWAGYIDPYGGAEKVPDDQLFFLGGTSDVRGFDENMLRFDADDDPVGGGEAAYGSLEARIDLGLNFELTLFYDVGNVADVFDDSVSDDIRSTAGLGLRYVTPIGPIGFLYGFKLDRKDGESPGQLHFAMGYTF